MIGKSLNEKLDALPEARRYRVLSETDRLHSEHLTLQELRKAKKFTKARLAAALDFPEATIAQMEKRSDLMLPTLRSYIEATGGKLSLIVELRDRAPVSLEVFGDSRLRC